MYFTSIRGAPRLKKKLLICYRGSRGEHFVPWRGWSGRSYGGVGSFRKKNFWYVVEDLLKRGEITIRNFFCSQNKKFWAKIGQIFPNAITSTVGEMESWLGRQSYRKWWDEQSWWRIKIPSSSSWEATDGNSGNCDISWFFFWDLFNFHQVFWCSWVILVMGQMKKCRFLEFGINVNSSRLFQLPSGFLM